MGPVFIVVVHEVLVGVAALGVVVPVAGVGPFLVEGAVETFDFAVGLGPVPAGCAYPLVRVSLSAVRKSLER